MDISFRPYTDVSVIIPLYKGNRFCDRLLDMLEKNCVFHSLYRKCEVEVIFVNDHPDEKIIIRESDRHFSVDVINQDKNRGIHASRVKGIVHSNGEYIIMLDQDDLVTEDWLYHQWTKMVSTGADFCVCNGWNGRFRVLWEEESFKKKVNDVGYYLTVGNAICSPGQVMMRKKRIPRQWLENIQRCNGADDFLLWIIILKENSFFLINDRHLYYHTPERSLDSIGSTKMLRSLKETADILQSIGLLDREEMLSLDKQIKRMECLNDGQSIEKMGEIDLNSKKQLAERIKFQKMFHVMLDWMRLKDRGIKVADFFEKNSFYDIAIYGMGYIGEYLCDELKDSNICVRYGIDRSAIDYKKRLIIHRMDDELEKVDVIVVTILEGTEKVVDAVKTRIGYTVVTITEMLVSLGQEILIEKE